MKAWQVQGWGEPEEMTLAETPVPEPGAGQIRIANRAMAINFFDILLIQGKYQVKPPFPFTPGAEVSGVVDAVGSGVSGFKAGDRVLSAPMSSTIRWAGISSTSLQNASHRKGGCWWSVLPADAFPRCR